MKLSLLHRKNFAASSLLLVLGLFAVNIPVRAETFFSSPASQLTAQNLPDTLSNADIAELFLDAFQEERFDEAWLALHWSLQKDLSVRQIAENWAEAQGALGEYKGRGESRIIGDTVVTVEVEFAKVSDELIFIFNDRHEIIGIDFPQVDWDVIQNSD